MGRKTRRYGTLRQLVERDVKEMTKGTEFSSKELSQRLEEEFEAKIVPQVVGMILRNVASRGDLTHYRPSSNESKIWVKQ